MFSNLVRSAHPGQQPWITRQSYAHEIWTALTFPVAVALVEGGVVGILARRAFGVSPAMFAVIMAAPSFANVTSILWARMARGRRKVRCIVAIQAATLVCIGLIAVLPTRGVGPLALTLLVIVIRCLLAGIITLRSTVWRMNYPRPVRAQVTGKLALVASLVVAVVPLVGYAVMDTNPEAFRVIYPVGVLVAMIGVIAFSRVRIRGERDLLRYETRAAVRPQPHGTMAPIYEYDPEAVSHTFWSVLRHDHLFRQYQICQFLLGSSNMMAQTVLIFLVAELTTDLQRGYVVAISITTMIPLLLGTLTLPLWARYLDRTHIVPFRVVHSLFFMADHVASWVGGVTGLLWVLALGRVFQGAGQGGAILAWQLGHNDFADRHMVALYMGIHVTLTGVRGAIAPFLGMLLFTGWEPWELPWAQVRGPGVAGMGAHVFLVSLVVASGSWVGFVLLSRRIARGGT